MMTTSSTITSYNPATGEALGDVKIWTAEEVKAAVANARELQHKWAKTPLEHRLNIFEKAHQIILAEAERLATLITRENGKPLVEAYTSELFLTLDVLAYYIKAAPRLLGAQQLKLGWFPWAGRSSRIERQPVGVVAAITPWNFPFAIPVSEILPALIAGNSVVLKPSELTPLIAVEIGKIFEKAGLPQGVLTVATGNGTTGAALVAAKPQRILFTGSVATGRKIAVQAAEHLIPCTLELGGKDPMIVLADANMDQVVKGAVWAAMSNSGQACASVERLYVHRSRHDELVARLEKAVAALRQGNGLEPGIDVGPMINERQLGIVERQVEDARQKGAQVLVGGERNRDFPGTFYKPTLLTGVDHQMSVMRDETFGPVLPVMAFDELDEAVQLANDTNYGLTASIWGSDSRQMNDLARRLESGIVTVNEACMTYGICQSPWGGVKESGIGHTHGPEGLYGVTAIQHTHQRHMLTDNPWWYPYPAGKAGFVDALIKLAHAPVGEKLAAIPKVLSGLKGS